MGYGLGMGYGYPYYGGYGYWKRNTDKEMNANMNTRETWERDAEMPITKKWTHAKRSVIMPDTITTTMHTPVVAAMAEETHPIDKRWWGGYGLGLGGWGYGLGYGLAYPGYYGGYGYWKRNADMMNGNMNTRDTNWERDVETPIMKKWTHYKKRSVMMPDVVATTIATPVAMAAAAEETHPIDKRWWGGYGLGLGYGMGYGLGMGYGYPYYGGYGYWKRDTEPMPMHGNMKRQGGGFDQSGGMGGGGFGGGGLGGGGFGGNNFNNNNGGGFGGNNFNNNNGKK